MTPVMKHRSVPSIRSRRRPGYAPATRSRRSSERCTVSASTIRRLLAEGRTINMPGLYDALSARLAEQAGFEVGFVSGYAVSAARLASPDVGYLGAAEMAQTAGEVCAVTR